MKLSKRVLLVLLAVLLCLPAWGCGKDTGEDTSDIGIAPFDGRYQKNGDVRVGDSVYKEVADCPYTFETVTWTMGWVGSRKKPRKADYNAYMKDEVLLLVEDTLYCHRDHYDRFLAELQSDLQPTEVFFSFFVSLTHSYQYTLSAQQRQALVDVLATVTPAAAGTLLTEKDGAYAYDMGVPMIVMSESAYLDNVQWCTLLRSGESYYLLKGYKKILLPYTLAADTMLYPVPESYNEAMKNIFLCEGGELKEI